MKKFAIVLAALIISACGSKESNTYMGHEYVDMGLSVKWATCNIGAQNPEEAGNYYAWGDLKTKDTYSWKNSRFYQNGNSPSDIVFKKYNERGDSFRFKQTLELADDVANVEWGGDWRMPTMDEIDELYRKCDWKWTTQNGVAGVIITSKVEGYTDRSIFMPASGEYDKHELRWEGVCGETWSGSYSTDRDRGYAYTLYFSKDGSSFDSFVMDDLFDLYMWYGTEEEYLDDLSDTLQAKFRALIDGGNSDINKIPQPLLEEYRDFMHRRYKHSGSFRYQGLPVRAVFK